MAEEEKLEEEKVEETATEEKPQGLMAEAKKEEEKIEDEEINHDVKEAELKKPDYLPEEYWDEENGTKLEALMDAFTKQEKSYQELRKKMSRGDHKPPEKYTWENLGEVDPDDALLGTYTEWAKENGITQDAFDKLGQAFTEYQNNFVKDAEMDLEKERQLLGKNANEIINSNVEWGRGLVAKGVFTEADYDQLEILGGSAKGQRVIQKIRGITGEKEIPIASIEGEAPDQEELMMMVQDARYQNDPTYRKKVEKMYQEAYSNL
tara:strand:- start:217 stop:1008 length:792 start_codon:yes stop_codon:yes gene_type:complete